MAKRYRMIDDTTSETTRKILEEVDSVTQPRYDWPNGRFGFVGMVYMFDLIMMDLPKDAMRLALLMFHQSQFNDCISMKPLGEYADMLKIGRPRISEYLNTLERLGVVARLGGRFVMMNPQLFWHGNSTEQRNAVKRWAAIHRPEIVFSRDRRKQSA